MVACRTERPFAPKLVETLLSDQRTDVNQPDELDRTALHWAAFHNQPAEILNSLIDAGADLARTDIDGDTALHKALCSYECTKFLLETGSDVNLKDRFAMTPLLRILSWGTEGDIEVLRLLLDYGADLDATNYWGETPRSIVAKWNRESYLIDNREELLVILNERAEKRSSKITGRNLEAAAPSRTRSFCHEVPKKADDAWVAGLTSQELSKELVRAIKRKEDAVALKLLEVGTDPNMTEWRGESQESVLYLAARHGCSEVVAEMVTRGVDQENTERHPSLYVAAKRGHTEIVEELLKFGADVNWSDWHGQTALMAACVRRKESTKEIVSLLLADPRIAVNQEDESGRSALHYAAFWWQPVEVIWLLLQAEG